MSRKRTRRKVYDLVNPITRAMEGASTTPDKLLNDLRIRELASLDAFARGAAGEQEFYDMNALVGLTREFAKRGVGPEALDACDRASVALQADWERHQATGRWGTTGPGLQAYREVYEFHDLQRQSASRAEYEEVIRKVTARVRFAKPEA